MTVGLVEIPAIRLARDENTDTAVGQATYIGPLAGGVLRLNHIFEPFPPSKIRPVRHSGVE